MSKKQIVIIVITVLSAIISAIACAFGIPYPEVDTTQVEEMLTDTEAASYIPARATAVSDLAERVAVSEQDTQTTV